MKQFIAEQSTYYIAHNNDDIIHYGVIKEGNCVCTGQPELETFFDENLWEERLIELGVTEEEINQHKLYNDEQD